MFVNKSELVLNAVVFAALMFGITVVPSIGNDADCLNKNIPTTPSVNW